MENISQNVPTSWNYGSFHLHSRLYTSLMQKNIDPGNQSHAVRSSFNQTAKNIVTDDFCPPRPPYDIDTLNASVD